MALNATTCIRLNSNDYGNLFFTGTTDDCIPGEQCSRGWKEEWRQYIYQV